MVTTLLGVKNMVEVYPPKYAPSKELGDNAISKLRSIARKVPDLEKFRALLVKQCENRGSTKPKAKREVTWSDIRDVLNKLQEVEKKAKEESSAETKEKRPTTARNMTLKRKIGETFGSEDSDAIVSGLFNKILLL